jgi:hypothetical protein
MKGMPRIFGAKRLRFERGQSMVELAIFLPIFILLIAGIVELGYYLNRYLNILDASREAARYGADLDPVGTAVAVGNPSYNPAYNHNSPLFAGAVPNCDDPALTDFYAVLACYAEQNLPYKLDASNGYDDIVVSAFTIKNGIVCSGWRWPDYMDGVADKGWSYLGNQVSQFSNARIDTMIPDDSPQQGLLILEMFYLHRQALALPFFTIFVPRDIGIYLFSIMPNPTAGSLDCP